MKKVVRILLIISVLSLTGCDFLRMVAGRPTSAQIAEKQRLIDARMLADSLAALAVDSLECESDDSLWQEAERELAEQIAQADLAAEIERAVVAEAQQKAKVAAAEKRARAKAAATEKAVNTLKEIGIVTNSKFTFGTPLDIIECKYNLVVGVYRNPEAAGNHFNLCTKAGFEPFFVNFENGAKALCLCGSDDAAEILDVVSKADSKVCPVDAWVYVKAE